MKDIPSSQGFSWQQVLGAVLLMIAALTLGYAMLLLCTFFEACLIRKNDSGRIYGITFIDDTEGIALNGSRLGKGYAANGFEAYFADSTQNLFLDERLYGKLPNMKQGDTVLAHILTKEEKGDNLIDEVLEDLIGDHVDETAKTLSEGFGKVLQQRQSMTINRNDKSTSISTQLDSLIPASKISNLTQGMFVGAVSDNFDERIEQKIFHAEIVVDVAKVSAETKTYEPIPVIAEFTNKDGSDNLSETIEANYKRVKQEVLSLVETEIERIKATPEQAHLIKE